MPTIKVSIIVPVYNGARYVAAALNSALAQSYKNIEIIIVNDGSTDDSRDKISPYIELPNVRYIEQQNRGVAAARNAGIRAATGDLIAFLDQDDLWLNDKLEIQVDYLSNHPGIPLVHANQDYIDDNGEPIEFVWPTDASGNCFREMFIRNRIAVLTVLLRRECFDQVGFFNEALSGSDDYEMWLRIAWRFPIGHINRTVALYRFHGTNESHDHFKMTRTDFAAIQSVVNQLPDLYRSVGARTVKNRLGDLAYQLGCWYGWSAQQPAEAKRYFLLSAKHRPFHLPTYRKLLWCSLSSNERRALSWYWSKISKMSCSSDRVSKPSSAK